MKNTAEIINCERKGETVIFTPKGDVDHHSANIIKKMIDSELFVERPKEMYLDLSKVDFMDSSGLGLILGRYRIATELGVSFSVLNPNSAAERILKLAGCERMINIVRKKDVK